MSREAVIFGKSRFENKNLRSFVTFVGDPEIKTSLGFLAKQSLSHE